MEVPYTPAGWFEGMREECYKRHLMPLICIACNDGGELITELQVLTICGFSRLALADCLEDLITSLRERVDQETPT